MMGHRRGRDQSTPSEATALRLRYVWIGNDAFEHRDDFERPVGSHAFGRHRECLAIVRDPEDSFLEGFSVYFRSCFDGLRVGPAAKRQRARRNAGDWTAVEIDERTTSSVRRERLWPFGNRLPVFDAVSHHQVSDVRRLQAQARVLRYGRRIPLRLFVVCPPGSFKWITSHRELLQRATPRREVFEGQVQNEIAK